jgi:hypothetical protein
MQFIKTLFVATVVIGSISLPTFASEEFSLGGNDNAAASFDHRDGDHGGGGWDNGRDNRDHGGGGWDNGRDNRDHRGDGRDWRRPRPRFVTCFARNITGRTFIGRAWNAYRAEEMALDNCQSRSFGPLGFTCRVVGCR